MSKTTQKSFSQFTASIITTISIALVLFLLGLTALVGFTAKGLTSYLKENLGVMSIELPSDVSEQEVQTMLRSLDANPYIKTVRYVSKEEVKGLIVEDLGRDPQEVLGYDPSRSYFDISIKAEYVNVDSLKVVERSLKGRNLIKSMVYNDDDISYASANLSAVGSVLLLLAVILVFISFTLIRSIIQLNIYSKRFTINTMQLVGATNSFIRRPFVWNMIACGFVAAILANISITGVIYYVIKAFPNSISIMSMTELLIVYGIVFVFGFLIAVIATNSAVNKYLRMTTNKIYRA